MQEEEWKTCHSMFWFKSPALDICTSSAIPPTAREVPWWCSTNGFQRQQVITIPCKYVPAKGQGAVSSTWQAKKLDKLYLVDMSQMPE